MKQCFIALTVISYPDARLRTREAERGQRKNVESERRQQPPRPLAKFRRYTHRIRRKTYLLKLPRRLFLVLRRLFHLLSQRRPDMRAHGAARCVLTQSETHGALREEWTKGRRVNGTAKRDHLPGCPATSGHTAFSPRA